MFLLLALVVCLVGAETVHECNDHPGHYQSPINIDTSTVQHKNIGYLQWSKGYDKIPNSMSLTSNGHTLKLKVEANRNPLTILFPMFSERYEFAEIHFHWGDTRIKGGEHTIDHKTFPIEMHAVHFQMNNASLPKYVVVGYVFTLQTRGRNKHGPLDKILKLAKLAARLPDTPMPVKKFKLSELFGKGPFPYYTYEGSLTVSPFDEGVRWVVAKNPLSINPAQLNVFHEAAEIEDGMLNNYRCPQDLENRTVYYNK